MKFRAAIALLAFAVPAFAQHGGARAGSFAGRGFSAPAGFSSHPAFAHSGFGSPGFSRPAPPVRFGASGNAGFRGSRSPNYSGFRAPYYANRFAAYPSRFAAGRANNTLSAGRSHGGDRDGDRFDHRRRDFQNWRITSYPYWAGYPYLYDPNAYNLGLYDWNDSDDSGSGDATPGMSGTENDESAQSPGNNASDETGQAPFYPPAYPSARPPYSGEATAEPQRQIVPGPSSGLEQPLTVIFRGGRAPIKVQNYMMTATVLTDLDREHYEQIPLDEIDVSATAQVNKTAGLDFQVPAAARN